MGSPAALKHKPADIKTVNHISKDSNTAESSTNDVEKRTIDGNKKCNSIKSSLQVEDEAAVGTIKQKVPNEKFNKNNCTRLTQRFGSNDSADSKTKKDCGISCKCHVIAAKPRMSNDDAAKGSAAKHKKDDSKNKDSEGDSEDSFTKPSKATKTDWSKLKEAPPRNEVGSYEGKWPNNLDKKRDIKGPPKG